MFSVLPTPHHKNTNQGTLSSPAVVVLSKKFSLIVDYNYENCSTVSVMVVVFLTNSLPWLALGCVLFTSVWYYFRFKYSFWKKKGVKFINPVIPFGNMRDVILMHKASTEMVHELYETFPQEPYVGIYEFLTPVLLIRDTELIKQVMVKDFAHFQVQ
jgi:hypothetical protein